MSETILLPKTELSIDRRGLFTKGARLALSGTAVAMLAGIGTGIRPASAATMSADIDTLNVALGLEHEAIAAYQVGAESGLLSKGVLGVAVGFQSDHKQHRDVLIKTIRQLGGKPVADVKHKFPVDKLKNEVRCAAPSLLVSKRVPPAPISARSPASRTAIWRRPRPASWASRPSMWLS